MGAHCVICGKAPHTGNKVSHANNKTKRRWLPNLQNVTLLSDALNRSVSLRISTNALKSVEHNGGLDAFLLKARDGVLSLRAQRLTRAIKKKAQASA